jgi:hypothetical protein
MVLAAKRMTKRSQGLDLGIMPIKTAMSKATNMFLDIHDSTSV